MSNFEPLSDEDVEALLTGRETPGLAAWAGVIERIRQEATASVDTETAGTHVLRAAEAAASLPAQSPVPSRRSPATWRRRTVFAGLFSTLIGKIVIGVAAVAAATAGAGAANILPEPVDNFIEHNFVGQDELDKVEAQIREQARIQQELEGEGSQTQTQTQEGQQSQNQQGPGNDDATQNQNQQGQNQQGPGNDDATQNQNQQGQDMEGQQNQNQQDQGDGDGAQTQTQSREQDQTQTQTHSRDTNRIQLGDCTQVRQGLDG